ncbi:cobalamin-dependent protein [Tateyamaria omphalii]|uniref:cobalamin B12-binding domain-containing protein n=1 Tax=Tateyamaria omphalii TaxID=299262 RepID=UPI001C991BA5|nr:cobalamin-dependent protein [Tateyamaria omphalii]MBY5935374.1 cobalamin-dependent protein [Tateyamaria omphalii]
MPTGSVEDLAREVLARLNRPASEKLAEQPAADQIDAFCYALLSNDDQAGAMFIQEVRRAGASVEVIYLKYLADAACQLGRWWDEDRVSFTDVTRGTSRLYAIMHAMRHHVPITAPATAKSAHFVSVPGETHTLGVRMAADLFRRDGWDVTLLIGKSHEELVAEIGESHSIVIGISAAGGHALDALSKLVVALRLEKPDAALFVSGQILETDADTVSLMDIDGMAHDFETAQALIECHWDKVSARQNSLI